jgi:hypothetical protein
MTTFRATVNILQETTRILLGALIIMSSKAKILVCFFIKGGSLR